MAGNMSHPNQSMAKPHINTSPSPIQKAYIQHAKGRSIEAQRSTQKRMIRKSSNAALILISSFHYFNFLHLFTNEVSNTSIKAVVNICASKLFSSKLYDHYIHLSRVQLD